MQNRSSISLDEEIKQVQQQVKSEPSNGKYRVHLFQLYAQASAWQKALAQLQIVAQLSADAELLAYTYRAAIAAELLREEVFAGKRRPHVLGAKTDWVELIIDALAKQAAGDFAAASELRAQALELAPTVGGQMDQKAFAWLADADSRVGPVCELVLDGQYCWAAYDALAEVRLEKPQDLRDLVWLPAHVRLPDQEPRAAFMPARYAGASDELIDGHKRSLLTTWAESPEGTWIGSGVRVLTTDTEEKSLLDVRHIEFLHQPLEDGKAAVA